MEGITNAKDKLKQEILADIKSLENHPNYRTRTLAQSVARPLRDALASANSGRKDEMELHLQAAEAEIDVLTGTDKKAIEPAAKTAIGKIRQL